MKRVPTSVMVISIIGIILSAFSFMGLCFNFASLFIEFGGPNPVLDALKDDKLIMASSIAGLVVGIPLSILLLVASIGSIKLSPWARKGMITYAWCDIARLCVGILFMLLYSYPKMYEAIQNAGALPPGVREGMIGGMFGGICGALIAPIYPIFILIYYKKQHVIDAFNGIFPAAPTPFPVDYPNPPDQPPGQFP